MKKIILIVCLCCLIQKIFAQAPDSWTEKNGIGLNAPASALLPSKYLAVSFGIGNKGYIGTARNPNDFWEYDPATNTIIQKAPPFFTPRWQATGFSIGNKGYIGLGRTISGVFLDDFWEYDPATNTWTQKANFGGGVRTQAVGFSIGNKGYIGTGDSSASPVPIMKNDFWEYNPSTNSWAQKANFGGGVRSFAVGFSLGNKGYIGTGYDGSSYTNDFWEYDPITNSWSPKANCSGMTRSGASGFSIGNYGYTGLGSENTGMYHNDFWQYNPASNTWTQKANFGGTARGWATGFSSGAKGYLGTGYNNGEMKNDFWEYDPSVNTWTQKFGYPEIISESAVGFNIGNTGFLGTGKDGTVEKNDFWEYDAASDTWTQKANFGGSGRWLAAGFRIGNKGYIGTGSDGSNYMKDFWEYNITSDAWTQKADFGGSARFSATGFSIGNKGYIGTGIDGSYKNDFWEYNPVLNVWTQKANFGGTARKLAMSFSIGNKGYIGTGLIGTSTDSYSYKNDFWEYDPATNVWTQKANAGGTYKRFGAVGFSIGNKGYMGTGTFWTGSFGNLNDFWEYDPVLNIWTPRANYGGFSRRFAMGFTANGKGYLGSGSQVQSSGSLQYLFYDFWEYTPICTTPSSTIYSSGTSTFCNGDSVFIYANNGYAYQWKKNGTNIQGATTYFYYAKTTGNYTCALTNSCGAVTSSVISVTVNSLPSATITPAGPTTFCSGGSVVLNAPTGTNKTYQWKKGANLVSGATLSSYTATTGGKYKVIVTNTVTGCSKTTVNATVVTVNALPAATITPQGPTTFCAGGSVVLAANTGTGLSYKWKKGSNFISGATLSNYTATTGGNYKVQVTNSNGCSKTSGNVVVTVPCREGVPIAIGIDFTVYPNPNPGEFTIKFSANPTPPIQIELTDEIGKVVKRFETNDETVVIKESNLANGIYSLTVRSKDMVITKKITVVK